MNIISFGEALIDFKQMGDQLDFHGSEGGSPMNVVIAASRLGAEAGFVGQVSSDFFGKRLLGYMQDNGLNTDFVLEHPAPSTLAFVANVEGEVEYSFMNNETADTLYDPKPRPELPKSVKFMMFGSISLLKDPTASAITETVAMHRNRCSMVLDPNVRPALIADKAQYLVDLKRWLRLAHIVKVSTQDLNWLYPDESSEAIAKGWLERGPEAVIITDGGDGLSLYRQEHPPLQLPSPSVNVVDTVGAGDTFTGALMARLLEKGKIRQFSAMRDDSWKDALSFAAAAAAVNCTRSGAQPPTREELISFMSWS